MTDYFALLGVARRPWLGPEELKEKYFARARSAPADAELNEAFRVLSDPKLRLHHLLILAGADLRSGRDIPPSLGELFWNTGTLLREVDHWLLRHGQSNSALGRALLSGERAKLEDKLAGHRRDLERSYENELQSLRVLGDELQPDEMENLIQRYDAIAYLSRLREQLKEKSVQLQSAIATDSP